VTSLVAHKGLKLLGLVVLLSGLLLSPVSAGGAWSPPLNLAPSSADAQSVSVAVDVAGRTHVVWSEESRLWHRIKSDGAWSLGQDLGAGSEPHLVADPTYVHLVFVGGALGEDVHYTAWDPAENWRAPVNVSESPTASFSPTLAVHPEEGLAVIWVEAGDAETLLYIGRSHTGDLWSAAPIPNARGYRPVATFGPGGRLIVAWEDLFDVGLAWDILVSEWEGGKWSLPVDVSFSPLSDSKQPQLIAGPAGLALVWLEEGQVLLSQRDAISWTEPVSVWSAGATALAGVGDNEGIGHLAWIAGGVLRYRSWDLASNSWRGVVQVAGGLLQAHQVALAADADGVRVAWLATGPSGIDPFFASNLAPEVGEYTLYLPLVQRP
jgi:hypothetical protein